MDKMLRGIIDLSVSVFDGFVIRLGRDLVNSSRVGCEKAYSDNMAECPVPLTHVSGAGASSVSCRSVSEGEDEDRSCTSKRSRSGNVLRHLGVGKSRSCR